MGLADWIAGQRWFRAKARTVASVASVDEARLTDATRLVVLEVGYADGGEKDRYLVPLAGDAEPADGDGAWREMVAAMARGAVLRGEAGGFRCDATPALAELLPSPEAAAAGLSERRLRVEQSNTSVVLGERLILKLFRLLEPGINPDLEIGAFLVRAGFDGTPALCGSATYLPDGGEPCAAAILQAYVPSPGDGWSAMLDALARDPEVGVAMAATVGGLTRRLHDALASRPAEEGFPARPATAAEAAGWAASAEAQLAAALGAVQRDAQDRLAAVAGPVRARFADAFQRAGGDARISRIHGDYHLGQLLASAGGEYLVIDFEGEPARPLAERRAATSPLRDVAGMLRSLDYAARTAERGGSGFDAGAWLGRARAAFLGAYGAIGPSGAALVEAFELEKACYEIRYEANNRPAWLWLPLAAVERMAAG